MGGRTVRVLHVFKDYFPPTRGGVEQHINDVVHSLEGFEFAVLTTSRSRHKRNESDGGVRVIRTPEYARPVSTPVTPSWAKLLRESGADLVHFHVPNPFGELMFLASRTRIPMVATYHADITGRQALVPFFLPFQKRFLRKARRIVVSNPRLIENSPSLAANLDRVDVIPFGVDPDQWAPRPPLADEIRSKYPPPLVLFLGRLVSYKGLGHLIDAVRRTEAALVIAGDGPERESLEAAAGRLRGKRVFFAGEVADAERPAYYHAADLFVLPSISRAEAFGISMLEAMACGTPVVSTELGTGTSWVNRSGSTGLVVDAGDAAALAGAIKAILGDDRRREEMGQAAVARVRESFTKTQMLDALAALYRDVGRQR